MVYHRPPIRSRRGLIGLIGSYLACFFRNGMGVHPIHPDHTGQTPPAPMPKEQTQIDCFKIAAAHVSSIRNQRLAVARIRVATRLQVPAWGGSFDVMSMFEMRGGRIRNVIVSYDD